MSLRDVFEFLFGLWCFLNGILAIYLLYLALVAPRKKDENFPDEVRDRLGGPK